MSNISQHSKSSSINLFKRVVSCILICAFLFTNSDISLAKEIFENKRSLFVPKGEGFREMEPVFKTNEAPFIFNSAASYSALAAPSRFKPPIETRRNDDGTYDIIINDVESLDLNDTYKSFKEDAAFLYLSHLIGQALYLNLSESGLKDWVDKELSHVNFTKFDPSRIYQKKGSFYLPYKRKNRGDELMLKFFKLEGNAKFPDTARIPLTDGSVIGMEVIGGEVASEGAPLTLSLTLDEAKAIFFSAKSVPDGFWEATSRETRLWFVNELARLLDKDAGALNFTDFVKGVFGVKDSDRKRSLRALLEFYQHTPTKDLSTFEAIKELKKDLNIKDLTSKFGRKIAPPWVMMKNDPESIRKIVPGWNPNESKCTLKLTGLSEAQKRRLYDEARDGNSAAIDCLRAILYGMIGWSLRRISLDIDNKDAKESLRADLNMKLMEWIKDYCMRELDKSPEEKSDRAPVVDKRRQISLSTYITPRMRNYIIRYYENSNDRNEISYEEDAYPGADEGLTNGEKIGAVDKGLDILDGELILDRIKKIYSESRTGRNDRNLTRNLKILELKRGGLTFQEIAQDPGINLSAPGARHALDKIRKVTRKKISLESGMLRDPHGETIEWLVKELVKRGVGQEDAEEITINVVRAYGNEGEYKNLISRIKSHKIEEEEAKKLVDETINRLKLHEAFDDAVSDLVLWLCGKRPEAFRESGVWDIGRYVEEDKEAAAKLMDRLEKEISGNLSQCRTEFLFLPGTYGIDGPSLRPVTEDVFKWILKNKHPVLDKKINDISVAEYIEYFFKPIEEKREHLEMLLRLIKSEKEKERIDQAIEEMKKRLAMLERLRYSDSHLIDEYKYKLKLAILDLPGEARKEAERILEERRREVEDAIEANRKEPDKVTIIYLYDLHHSIVSNEMMFEFGHLPDEVWDRLEPYERGYIKNHRKAVIDFIINLLNKRFREREGLAEKGEIEGLGRLSTKEAFKYLTQYILPRIKARAEDALRQTDINEYISARHEIIHPEPFVMDSLLEKERNEYHNIANPILNELDREALDIFADNEGIKELKKRQKEKDPDKIFKVRVVYIHKKGTRIDHYDVEYKGIRGRVDYSEGPGLRKAQPDDYLHTTFSALLINCEGIFPYPTFSIRKAEEAESIPQELKKAAKEGSIVNVTILYAASGFTPLSGTEIEELDVTWESPQGLTYMCTIPGELIPVSMVIATPNELIGRVVGAVPVFKNIEGKDVLTFDIKKAEEMEEKINIGKIWDELRIAKQKNAIVYVNIIDVTRYRDTKDISGFTVEYKGIRGFIPLRLSGIAPSLMGPDSEAREMMVEGDWPAKIISVEPKLIFMLLPKENSVKREEGPRAKIISPPPVHKRGTGFVSLEDGLDKFLKEKGKGFKLKSDKKERQRKKKDAPSDGSPYNIYEILRAVKDEAIGEDKDEEEQWVSAEKIRLMTKGKMLDRHLSPEVVKRDLNTSLYLDSAEKKIRGEEEVYRVSDTSPPEVARPILIKLGSRPASIKQKSAKALLKFLKTIPESPLFEEFSDMDPKRLILDLNVLSNDELLKRATSKIGLELKEPTEPEAKFSIYDGEDEIGLVRITEVTYYKPREEHREYYALEIRPGIKPVSLSKLAQFIEELENSLYPNPSPETSPESRGDLLAALGIYYGDLPKGATKSKGFDHNLENFRVGENYQPPNFRRFYDEKETIISPEAVDLKRLPPGTILNIKGYSPGADYYIQVEQDRTLTIWRNTDGQVNGFTSSPEALGSSEEHLHDSLNKFGIPGILKKGWYFIMPYFGYHDVMKGSKARQEVSKPRTFWRDTIRSIRIILPEEIGQSLIKVPLPEFLWEFFGMQNAVVIAATTVGGLASSFNQLLPEELVNRLVIFLNGEDINNLQEDRPLKQDDEIRIEPRITGGAGDARSGELAEPIVTESGKTFGEILQEMEREKDNPNYAHPQELMDLLYELIDPQKWYFFNDAHREYAIKLSKMNLEELREEDKQRKFYLLDPELKEYEKDHRNIGHGMHPFITLGHTLQYRIGVIPYLSDNEREEFLNIDEQSGRYNFRKFGQIISRLKEVIPETDKKNQKFLQTIDGEIENIQFIREVFYRWRDKEPKPRSYLLFGKETQASKSEPFLITDGEIMKKLSERIQEAIGAHIDEIENAAKNLSRENAKEQAKKIIKEIITIVELGIFEVGKIQNTVKGIDAIFADSKECAYLNGAIRHFINTSLNNILHTAEMLTQKNLDEKRNILIKESHKVTAVLKVLSSIKELPEVKSKDEMINFLEPLIQAQTYELSLKSSDKDERIKALKALMEMEKDGRISPAAEIDSSKINQHVHTFYSYNPTGETPESLVWRAHREGFYRFGIIEFDTIGPWIREALEAAEIVGLDMSLGMETMIGRLPEPYQNDETNFPGRIQCYFIIHGITNLNIDSDPEAGPILARLAKLSGERAKDAVEMLNSHIEKTLGDKAKEIMIDFDKDLAPLCPVGYFSERHIVDVLYNKISTAYNRDRNLIQEKLAELLEVGKSEINLDNLNKLKDLIRKKLLGVGGKAYVEPSPDKYISLDEFATIAKRSGGWLSYSFLASAESINDELEVAGWLYEKGLIQCANLITHRLKEAAGAERIKRVADFCRERNLPLIIGTELNAPDLPFVDNLNDPGRFAPDIFAYLKESTERLMLHNSEVVKEIRASIHDLQNIMAGIAGNVYYLGHDYGPLEYIEDINNLNKDLRGILPSMKDANKFTLQDLDRFYEFCRKAKVVLSEDKIKSFVDKVNRNIRDKDLKDGKKEKVAGILLQTIRLPRLFRLIILGFLKEEKVEQEDVEINDLLDTLCIIKNIESRVTKDYQIPQLIIRANEIKLARIFLNLLINAHEATYDEVGKIDLTTRREGAWAVVEISDAGPGIPLESLEKIWEPYFTTKEKGTGLGLSIVKSLVKELGGTIEVQSELGKGATFTIRLPASERDGETSPESIQMSEMRDNAPSDKDVQKRKEDEAPSGAEEDIRANIAIRSIAGHALLEAVLEIHHALLLKLYMLEKALPQLETEAEALRKFLIEAAKKIQELQDSVKRGIAISSSVKDTLNNVKNEIINKKEALEKKLKEQNLTAEDYYNMTMKSLTELIDIYETQIAFINKDVPKESLDINKLVEESVALIVKKILNPWIIKKGIEIRLAEKLPAISGNPRLLRRVLGNMVENASEAIWQKAKDGHISIETAFDQSKNEVLIMVSDNGPGVASKMLKEGEVKRRPEMFDLGASTKESGGLGLNEAWEIIVEDHGGSIEVESELGKGTTFTIRLPKKEENEAQDSRFNNEISIEMEKKFLSSFKIFGTIFGPGKDGIPFPDDEPRLRATISGLSSNLAAIELYNAEDKDPARRPGLNIELSVYGNERKITLKTIGDIPNDHILLKTLPRIHARLEVVSAVLKVLFIDEISIDKSEAPPAAEAVWGKLPEQQRIEDIFEAVKREIEKSAGREINLPPLSERFKTQVAKALEEEVLDVEQVKKNIRDNINMYAELPPTAIATDQQYERIIKPVEEMLKKFTDKDVELKSGISFRELQFIGEKPSIWPEDIIWSKKIFAVTLEAFDKIYLPHPLYWREELHLAVTIEEALHKFFYIGLDESIEEGLAAYFTIDILNQNGLAEEAAIYEKALPERSRADKAWLKNIKDIVDKHGYEVVKKVYIEGDISFFTSLPQAEPTISGNAPKQEAKAGGVSQKATQQVLDKEAAPDGTDLVQTPPESSTDIFYSFITNKRCQENLNTFRIVKTPQRVVEGGFLQCVDFIIYDSINKIGAAAHLNPSQIEPFDLDVVSQGVDFMIDRIRNKGGKEVNLQAVVIWPEYVENMQLTYTKRGKDNKPSPKMLSWMNSSFLIHSCLLKKIPFKEFKIPTNSFIFDSSNGAIYGSEGKPDSIIIDASNLKELTSFTRLFNSNNKSSPAKETAGVAIDASLKMARGVIGEYLEGTNLDWYNPKYAITLDDNQVDPFFRIVAELEGGITILGAGSDLVQLMLGLTKWLYDKDAEVNVISKKDADFGWKTYEELNEKPIKIPAWGVREKEVELKTVMVNSESSSDLRTYIKNASREEYLIKGSPEINVPLKHTAVAIVPAKGPITLWFRTKEDFDSYQNRMLTLPDVEKYPSDWGDAKEYAGVVSNTIEYSIVVYARAKRDNWHFEKKSLDIIRDLVRKLKPREIRKLVESVEEKIKDDFKSSQELNKILNPILEEFGIKLPAKNIQAGDVSRKTTPQIPISTSMTLPNFKILHGIFVDDSRLDMAESALKIIRAGEVNPLEPIYAHEIEKGRVVASVSGLDEKDIPQLRLGVKERYEKFRKAMKNKSVFLPDFGIAKKFLMFMSELTHPGYVTRPSWPATSDFPSYPIFLTDVIVQVQNTENKFDMLVNETESIYKTGQSIPIDLYYDEAKAMLRSLTHQQLKELIDLSFHKHQLVPGAEAEIRESLFSLGKIDSLISFLGSHKKLEGYLLNYHNDLRSYVQLMEYARGKWQEFLSSKTGNVSQENKQLPRKAAQAGDVSQTEKSESPQTFQGGIKAEPELRQKILDDIKNIVETSRITPEQLKLNLEECKLFLDDIPMFYHEIGGISQFIEGQIEYLIRKSDKYNLKELIKEIRYYWYDGILPQRDATDATVEHYNEYYKKSGYLTDKQTKEYVAKVLGAIRATIDILQERIRSRLGRIPDKAKEDSEIKEYIADLIRGFSLLDNITNKFFKTRGNFDTKGIPESVEINKSLEMTTRYFSSKNVIIKSELSESPLYVNIDPYLISEVWFNLIRNAREAFEKSKNAKITITSRLANKEVEIKFIDNAIGIKPEDIPHIFDKFWTTKEGGKGIGLWLVSEIIKNAGGRIEVESEPGKGTTFTIRLPASERNGETSPESTSDMRGGMEYQQKAAKTARDLGKKIEELIGGHINNIEEIAKSLTIEDARQKAGDIQKELAKIAEKRIFIESGIVQLTKTIDSDFAGSEMCAYLGGAIRHFINNPLFAIRIQVSLIPDKLKLAPELVSGEIDEGKRYVADSLNEIKTFLKALQNIKELPEVKSDLEMVRRFEPLIQAQLAGPESEPSQTTETAETGDVSREDAKEVPTPEAEAEELASRLSYAIKRSAQIEKRKEKIAAKEDKKECRNILIALEVQNEQLPYVRALAEAFEDMTKRLARKETINNSLTVNVKAVWGNSKTLRKTIEAANEGFNAPPGNIVVVGREETLIYSGQFDDLKGMAFLACFDPAKSPDWLKLLIVSLNIAFDLETKEKSKEKYSIDIEELISLGARIVRLTPTKPINPNEQEAIFNLQTKKLNIQA